MLTRNLLAAVSFALIWFVVLVPNVGHAQQSNTDLANLAAPEMALPMAPAVMPHFAPAEPQKKQQRVIDKKFIAMSIAMMAFTVSDLEKTQGCLARGTCVEMNPMLPRSRAGMYAVNLPINAAAMYLAYRLKASGHKTWWIAPVIETAGHVVGTGFRF
jgi:hypothetical protein